MSQNDQLPQPVVLGWGYVPAAVGAGLVPGFRGRGISPVAAGTGVVVLNLLPNISTVVAGDFTVLVTPHGATAQGIKVDVTVTGGAFFVNTYRGDTGAAIWVPFSFAVYLNPPVGSN